MRAFLLWTVAAVQLLSCGAFVAPTRRSVGGVVTGSSSELRAEAATAMLDASQRSSVDQIAAAISDLARKPDYSWGPGDGVLIGRATATLDARDAPGPSNIAWLASLCIAGRVSSLTINNGPLNNVPHLLSRACIFNENHLEFQLDFRPRAYGAYDQRDAAGKYPGPEELGRKAFEYSGNRMEYFNKFATDEVLDFLESTKASLEGAVDSVIPPSELDLLTRGPVALSLTMPLTVGNVEKIVAARAQAVNYWLGWALDKSHEHRPGAPVNTQYVYDTKYQQNAYGALLPFYCSLFGAADGSKLTAAESGPLDEAYVGGGS